MPAPFPTRPRAQATPQQLCDTLSSALRRYPALCRCYVPLRASCRMCSYLPWGCGAVGASVRTAILACGLPLLDKEALTLELAVRRGEW